LCEFLKKADKVKHKQRLFLRNRVSINFFYGLFIREQIGAAEKSAQARDRKKTGVNN